MVIDSFKTWILTSDLNDPALSVLLFIGIVLLLYAGIGIVLKSPNILLGTGIYALTGALFVYLGLWEALVVVVWFVGLLFLGYLSLSSDALQN